MTPRLFLDLAIRPALALLPAKMTSPEAEAMLVAIAMQESRLKHRLQIRGPARGFWQFELGTPETRGGVTGPFLHERTAGLVRQLCADLVIPYTPHDVYEAVAYNDVLAAGMARLLLYTDPYPLPLRGDVDGSWRCYAKRTWRPGKPHPQTWPAFYSDAWQVVAGPEVDGVPV
jgi:hypothetical protein